MTNLVGATNTVGERVRRAEKPGGWTGRRADEVSRWAGVQRAAVPSKQGGEALAADSVFGKGRASGVPRRAAASETRAATHKGMDA